MPPVLAVAWAGLWFRVAARYAWAVAVPPVRSDAPVVRAAYGPAALAAAHGLAARLGVRAHWAAQRVHWAARVSRLVWWQAGWDVPVHWALRLAWGGAQRALPVAWQARAWRAVRPAAPAARRVAGAQWRVQDGFLPVRRDLPQWAPR